MSSELAVKIATELGERIRLGELEGGHRLRQEHVGREFEASPGPVREAFRQLELNGLILSRPRRGVIVAEIDIDSVAEVSDMRAVLEPLALRDAVPNITAQDIKSARQALSREKRAKGDLVELEDANRQFHRTLLAPCSRPRLMKSIDELSISASRILLAMWRDLPNWPETSASQHVEILSAVEQKDVGRATDLLREHILGGKDALVQWMLRKEPS